MHKPAVLFKLQSSGPQAAMVKAFRTRECSFLEEVRCSGSHTEGGSHTCLGAHRRLALLAAQPALPPEETECSVQEGSLDSALNVACCLLHLSRGSECRRSGSAARRGLSGCS